MGRERARWRAARARRSRAAAAPRPAPRRSVTCASAAGGGEAAGGLVERARVEVAGEHRAAPERDPGLGEQPRAAADVERRPAGQVVDQLQAHRRRGVVAGAEALAGRLQQLAHARRARARGRGCAGTSRPASPAGGSGQPGTSARARTGRGQAASAGAGELGGAARRADQALAGAQRTGCSGQSAAKARGDRRVAVAVDEQPGGQGRGRANLRRPWPSPHPADLVARAPRPPSRRWPPWTSTRAWRGCARARGRPGGGAATGSSTPPWPRRASRGASRGASWPRRSACWTPCPRLAEAIRPGRRAGRRRGRRAWSGRPTGWCSAGTRPTRRSGCRPWSPPRRWSAGNAVVCRPSSRVRRTTGLVLEALAGRLARGRAGGGRPARAGGRAAGLGPRRPGRWSPTPRARPASATWPVSGAPTRPARRLRPYIPEGSGNDAHDRAAGRRPRRRRGRRGARRLRQRRPAVHVGQADDRRGRGLGGLRARAWSARSRPWWSATPTTSAPTSARSPRGRPAPAPARPSPRRWRPAAGAGGRRRARRRTSRPRWCGCRATPSGSRSGARRASPRCAGWWWPTTPPRRWRWPTTAPTRSGRRSSGPGEEVVGAACARRACWSTRARSTRTPTWWWAGWATRASPGRGPKIEQMVWARRVHRAGGC